MGSRVGISWLEDEDADELTALQLRNRSFFRDFVSQHEESFYTREAQLEYIRKGRTRRERDELYVCGIFKLDSAELIGGAMLAEVLRGPLQSCYIGYYMDEAHNGKGYMTEAIELLVDYGFRTLMLHRIEAGVMPRNIRSMRVLEKAGFHREGIARKNVNINGQWEDHQVLAIINEHWDGKM